jgi:curved DNA-binding protein CbpA
MTHYQILGLPNFATPQEVQKAFRRLAKQYHPDKHKGDPIFENKFKEVNASYQVLSNIALKAAYDDRIRYGFQQPITSKPSPPKYQSQPKKGEREFYSAHQSYLIKLAKGIAAMCFLVIVIAHVFVEHPKPLKELESFNKYHLNAFEQAIASNRFTLAEEHLDSLMRSKYSFLEIQKYAKRLIDQCSDNFDSPQHYDVTIHHNDLLSFKTWITKYNIPFTNKQQVKFILQQFDLNEASLALKNSFELRNSGIGDFDLAFFYTNELCKRKQYDEAANVVLEYFPNFILMSKNRFPVRFDNFFATTIMNQEVKAAFFQYLSMKKSFLDTLDIEEVDLLYNALPIGTEKLLCWKLYQKGFDKGAVYNFTKDEFLLLNNYQLANWFQLK